MKLPSTREPASIPPPPLRHHVPAGATVVMVVEGEPVLRALLADALRRDGYFVIPVDGSEAALTANCLCDQIDLILTDIRIPGIDGIELARQIKRDRRGLQVIFMSGYPADAWDLSPNTQMLLKPFTWQVLRDVLAEKVGRPRLVA